MSFDPSSPSLAGAVDLSTLANRSRTRLPAATPPPPPGNGHRGPTIDDVAHDGPMPTEFTLSLAGTPEGVQVVLGFGHLRWQFTPELARDLGQNLLGAADQAATITADGAPPAPGGAA